MSFMRDVETERVLAESRELHEELVAALKKLSRFVSRLDDYVEQHRDAPHDDQGDTSDRPA